ncbi:hypothetical protein JOC37_001532 [Desulfohalotomaculum tongense]|nr:hypothetical protein [Desulforadius tongensis]
MLLYKGIHMLQKEASCQRDTIKEPNYGQLRYELSEERWL